MATMTSNSQPTTNPRVGVAVFILRPSTDAPTTATTKQGSNLEFVVGRRLGSHGAGTIALPGGHLELNESFETCAAREVLEETGLVVRNVRFLTATNDVMLAEHKHYITIFVVCEVDGDASAQTEPEVLEPNKCAGWEWVQWQTMVDWVEDGSQKMFLPLINLVTQRPGVVPQLF